MSQEDKDYLETGADETPQTEDYSQEENLEEVEATPETQEEEVAETEDDNPTVKRYKEQAKGNKEEALRFREMILEQEIEKAGTDASAVLELHKKDPKLALEVAKHYDFDSIEAVEDFIAEQTRAKGEPISEEEINRRAERLAEKKLKEKIHEQALTKAMNKLNKLPEELQDIAKEKFDSLVGKRVLDDSLATEIVEMVTLYVQRDGLK